MPGITSAVISSRVHSGRLASSHPVIHTIICAVHSFIPALTRFLALVGPGPLTSPAAPPFCTSWADCLGPGSDSGRRTGRKLVITPTSLQGVGTGKDLGCDFIWVSWPQGLQISTFSFSLLTWGPPLIGGSWLEQPI